jgi:predicted nucleotidyltransferase
MRLSAHEREVIRQATAELAGPAARALVFGSRVRDNARGGDIDLLIELEHERSDSLALANGIGARIESRLGLQRIDVLVAGPQTSDSPVLSAARRDGIPL